MKDVMSKVDKNSRDNARMDRDRIKNPADVEPGMGDDFGWDDGSSDDSFGGFDSWDTGGSGLGSSGGSDSGGFGGGGFGGGGFGSGGFGTPPPAKVETEDKIFEVIGKILKGFGTFSGYFVKSFKTFDVEKQMAVGKSSVITGGIVSVAGLLLLLLGFGGSIGMSFLVGGLVSVGIAVPLFMFSYDKFQKGGSSEEMLDFSDASSDIFTPSEDAFGGTEGGGGFDFDLDEDEDFDMFGDEDDDTYSPSDTLDTDVDFSAFEEEKDFFDVESKMDSVLDTVEDNKGMFTRQYLYQKISDCLMPLNKDFDKVRDIKEGSDEFDAWDSIVQDSASLFKPKGNDVDMPYLTSAKDKLFYVLLEIKRVSWIKNLDQFVAEIVNICRFDKDTGNTDMNIYGLGNTVGDRIYIKIMKGETAMVSVKDIYRRMESEVLDSNNKMPIVLGIDAEGNPIMKDFKDIQSILVTGMPRSGKTWQVQSILTQMMFYASPSEINFYFLDPKAEISDFRQMDMPHIKKFVSDDASILAELRHIVKVEGPRRKKLIGGDNAVNIKDFKKANPDIELPYLYVVIDEVITLAERMEKDIKDEFQGLLLELVSQLPALGIRIIMIPHIVKDQILKKTITDLIPCRISVMGDAEHIEKSTGKKGFKHRLAHQGDMAVRFNNDETTFIHSAVLTDSNDSNFELFKFLTKFWAKLEPESVNDSWKQIKERQLATGGRVSSDLGFPKTEVIIEPFAKETTAVKTEPRKTLAQGDMDDLLGGLNDSDDEFDIFGGV